MGPRNTCGLPKKARREGPAVEPPDGWVPSPIWSDAQVVAHLRERFRPGAERESLWAHFQALKRHDLMKVATFFLRHAPAGRLSVRTPTEELRHLAFGLLADDLPDDQRLAANEHPVVLGLNETDLRECDGFAAAVRLAAPVLAQLRAEVEAGIGAVQTRSQRQVLDGVADRRVPTKDEFDPELLRRLSAILRNLRVWHFSHRLKTRGLQHRGGLLLSYSAVEAYLMLVNDALEGYHRFATARELYDFLYDACRCKDTQDLLLEFVLGLCEYAENRAALMLLYDRIELIQQVVDSKADSVELRVHLFLFTRIMRLFAQLRLVNADAVDGYTFHCGSLLWFDAKHVIRPKATFLVSDLVERMEDGSHETSLASALVSLVAEALRGWLHQFFALYGEEPWKNDFRDKWASDTDSDGRVFWQSVHSSLLGVNGVALWCGLPLRIWVEDKQRDLAHEFFPRRKANIDALIRSMPDKKVVHWDRTGNIVVL